MSIRLEDPYGYGVAELREAKVHGLPGIGCYTLVLNLGFKVMPPKVESTIRNVSVRLEWGDGAQRMIGVAQPDGQPLRLTQYTNEALIGFRFPLSGAQIEDIENRRNGGNFKLSMWFMCDLEQAGKAQSRSDTHEFEVRHQDWVESLERMGYCKAMLFELPAPGSDAPIGALVTKAQTFLLKGDYDQAVTLCRQAIEMTEVLAGDKSAASQAVKKYRETHRDMDTTERLLFLRESLKHATHLAVHHSPNHCGFSRDQARAILGSTITVLSLFAPLDRKSDISNTDD